MIHRIVAALLFLELNGTDREADEMALADLTIAVATGLASKTDVAEFPRRTPSNTTSLPRRPLHTRQLLQPRRRA